MVLVNLKTILENANKENYAVGAFNATDLNTARGIVAAAEELRAPIVLQFAEVHGQYISLETAANLYLDLAEKASVPICVHLDHGVNFDTIVKAIKLGYASVMVDASTKSIDENTALTKEIVRIAKPLNITVEAELGVMNQEDGSGKLHYDQMGDTFTDPQQAKDFFENTDVDALAIAFGTVHGLYKGTPHLNYQRIKEIKALTEMPLVMHGGSGLSDDEYRQSIQCGINKINYYSTMSFDVTNGLREYLSSNNEAYLFDVDMKIMELVQQNIMSKINVFGSAGKA